MDDVLKMFEGLTVSQVRQLRRVIIETLPRLREEVVQDSDKQGENNQNKRTVKHDKMQSKNEKR